MRILIVEDDTSSRRILDKILSSYGKCDFAADGKEAIEAYKGSWVKSEPYDLICMDIMMPNIDGHMALNEIRNMEREMAIKERDRVKVIMTTALDDPHNVFQSMYKGEASSYIMKPVDKQTLIGEVRKLGLIA